MQIFGFDVRLFFVYKSLNENITFSLHDGEIWKHLLRWKYVN